MAVVDTLLEYSVLQVSGCVIRGVKIAGLNSRNGRSYSASVLGKAAALYEDSPVYMLHGSAAEKRENSRSHDEHFGSLKGVHLRDTGLFGDLHVKQSHPMAQFILESDGSKFGLSHNVRAEMTDDRKTVTEILSVNSVDLVDNPATTTTLFEEEDMPSLDEIAELLGKNKGEILSEVSKIIDDRLATLHEEVEPKPEGKPKQEPPKRITVLEEAKGDPDAPEPIGNTHEDFLNCIRGFSKSNMKGAQA